MAIYIDSMPYLKLMPRKYALPVKDMSDSNGRMGYGNLVFLFTTDLNESIEIINKKDTCYATGNYYYYYYYNLVYRGAIKGKRYNIRDRDERKRAYDVIKKVTKLHPHPPSLLNTTPNRNCYFEMYTYVNIFNRLSKKIPPLSRIIPFWNFYRSIWNSEQTSAYGNKMVLINAKDFPNFSYSINNSIDNPIFVIYYSLYKKLDLIKDLDIDFIIFSGVNSIKVNPSKCDKDSYKLFRREINKLYGKISSIEKEESYNVELIKDEVKETIKEKMVVKYKLTGEVKPENDGTELTNVKVVRNVKKTTSERNNEKIKEEITQAVADKVNEVAEKISNETLEDLPDDAKTKLIETEAEIELANDKELVEKMYNYIQNANVPTKPVASARDKQLREKQAKITINNTNLDALLTNQATKKPITTTDVSSSLNTINENVKQKKFANLNKDYILNTMQSDLMASFKVLNDKDMPLYIDKVEIKDSSNELNYKDTYKITLVDLNKQRHIINVDIPKFLDYKFLYLGGNKKMINRHNFLYPVVKSGNDTVQIVTNYNKLFIKRYKTNAMSSVERILKLISSNEKALELFTVGDASSNNITAITTLEYDTFAKNVTKFSSKSCTIFFDQIDAKEYANKKNINIPVEKIFIGERNRSPIFIDINSQILDNGSTIADVIMEELPEELQNELKKTRSTKKKMMTLATIMKKPIPFVILLMFWEGISSIFKKMNLKYYFSARYPSELNINESVVRFKDGYVVYEADVPTSLLMNGLSLLDTAEYEFKDYDTNEPYIGYFKKVYGKSNIMNAIYNYYEFMIDPITMEILQDIDLPTDLIELCLYANNLLADDSYTNEMSQKVARIRSIEIIPAILYNNISRAYLEYKNSGGRKKMSLASDCVIKQLLAIPTVENYSTLNPVVEVEKDRTVSYKGYRGINEDRAYTQEKRSYDPSYVGIIAMETSPDGKQPSCLL